MARNDSLVAGHSPLLCVQISAALLALLPAALLPGLANPWIWPTLLAAALAAVFASFSPPAGRIPRALNIAILTFVLICALSAVLSAAPWQQLLGRAPRYEGLITAAALFAAFWAACRVLGPGAAPRTRRVFLLTTAFSAVALAAVAILESTGARPLGVDVARPGSLLGNATDQAILGVMHLVLLGTLALRTWRQTTPIHPLVVIGAAAGAVSVLLSASRAGLILLLAAMVWLTLMSGLRALSVRGRWFMGGAWIAVVILALSLPLTRTRFLGQSPLSSQTVEDRWVMWQMCGFVRLVAGFLQRSVAVLLPRSRRTGCR